MRLVVEGAFLKLAHQRPLLYRISLVQHPLIEIDCGWVVKISVLLGEDRARLVLADIEHRVDHALAIAFDGDIKAAVPKPLEPGASRNHALRHAQADLAPLVDQPNAKVFEGLVDGAIQ